MVNLAAVFVRRAAAVEFSRQPRANSDADVLHSSPKQTRSSVKGSCSVSFCSLIQNLDQCQ